MNLEGFTLHRPGAYIPEDIGSADLIDVIYEGEKSLAVWVMTGLQVDWGRCFHYRKTVLPITEAAAMIRGPGNDPRESGFIKAERYVAAGPDRTPVDPGAHYRCEIGGVKVDPFRMAEVIGITDPVQFTIFKKAWRMGSSVKDKRQDLLDIISAAKRGIEMINELEKQ